MDTEGMLASGEVDMDLLPVYNLTVSDSLLLYYSGSGDGEVPLFNEPEVREVLTGGMGDTPEVIVPDVAREPTNNPYWLPYIVALVIFLFCFLAVADLLVKYYWCERRKRKLELQTPDVEKALYLGQKKGDTFKARLGKPQLTAVTYHEQIYKPQPHRGNRLLDLSRNGGGGGRATGGKLIPVKNHSIVRHTTGIGAAQRTYV